MHVRTIIRIDAYTYSLGIATVFIAFEAYWSYLQVPI